MLVEWKSGTGTDYRSFVASVEKIFLEGGSAGRKGRRKS